MVKLRRPRVFEQIAKVRCTAILLFLFLIRSRKSERTNDRSTDFQDTTYASVLHRLPFLTNYLAGPGGCRATCLCKRTVRFDGKRLRCVRSTVTFGKRGTEAACVIRKKFSNFSAEALAGVLEHPHSAKVHGLWKASLLAYDGGVRDHSGLKAFLLI